MSDRTVMPEYLATAIKRARGLPLDSMTDAAVADVLAIDEQLVPRVRDELRKAAKPLTATIEEHLRVRRPEQVALPLRDTADDRRARIERALKAGIRRAQRRSR